MKVIAFIALILASITNAEVHKTNPTVVKRCKVDECLTPANMCLKYSSRYTTYFKNGAKHCKKK